MVLDVKALNWAAQNDLDTAKLKKAKVRVYGKWYYPELPADTPLVNLQTGERSTFLEGMVAGEVLWVEERDLKRARLGPYRDISDEDSAEIERLEELKARSAGNAGLREEFREEEPYLAMVRVPPAPATQGPEGPMIGHDGPDLVPITVDEAPAIYDSGDGSNIHLPLPTIAPLVLGFGISIAVLGIVLDPIILVVGLIWALVGAIGWIRIGLLEERSASHHG